MRVRRVSRGEGGAVPDLNGRADIGRCGFDHPRSKNQSRSHGEYTCINSPVTIALIPVESQFERSREIEERVGRGVMVVGEIGARFRGVLGRRPPF